MVICAYRNPNDDVNAWMQQMDMITGNHLLWTFGVQNTVLRQNEK